MGWNDHHLDDGPADTGNVRANELVTWFFANYEDPVHNMPWDEGEYVFIVPERDAREELEEHFPKEDEHVLDLAINEIGNHGWQWVKISDLDEENFCR